MRTILLLLAAVAIAAAQTQSPYYPYADPEPVTVCQMDMTQTPPVPAIDEATGLPRCFQVPLAVSKSSTLWMLNQKTTTINEDGTITTTLKYASWWDALVKHFINTFVLPILDQYPTDEVKTAKDNAEAAAKALDAAKAAILGAQVQ